MKRKPIFVFLLMLIIMPFLASCTYFNSLARIAESAAYSRKIPNKELNVNYYVDDTLYETIKTTDRNTFQFPTDPKKDDLNFGGWTYKDSYQTLKKDDLIYQDVEEINLYAYFSKGTHFSDNIMYNGPYFSKNGLPSLGDVDVLVVPVNLGGKTDDSMLNSINEAFNGTSESTGFESVKSFYNKSSSGRLNLDFHILNEWFTPKNDPSYYENYDSTKDRYYENGSGLILNEFLAAYDSKIDFSNYDKNKDGYIDAVWMIYNLEPDYTNTGFYWAYVTFSQNTSKKYDEKYPRNYGFASFYFMFEKDLEKKYGRELELYSMDDITYDAHTYIHETGHLMGLVDYYDSDKTKGGNGGTYSVGMMDANQGDLDPIDKLLLGWIDPYVVYPDSTNLTFEINPYTESNDVILVSKYKTGSIYNEYFLIQLYTNTGLNTHDRPIDYPSSKIVRLNNLKNLTDYGIRILHVNASTTKEYNGKEYDMPMVFTYNNSTTRNLFMDTIVNNSLAYETKNTKKIINSLALFNEANKLIDLKSSSYKMTNGSSLFFNVNIDSISQTKAKISIIF